jgi:hypothetical protein
MGVVVGILFLEETHEEKKHHRDRGVELGKRLLSCFQGLKSSPKHAKSFEEEPLLDAEEQLPGYQTTSTAQPLPSVTTADLQPPLDLETAIIVRAPVSQIPKTKIFTRPVVLIIITYGVLAL